MMDKDLHSKFHFISKWDQMDYDCYNKNASNIEEYMKIALEDNNCVAFNTLGFFKTKVVKLTRSPYFKSNDGLYIKKSRYNVKS